MRRGSTDEGLHDEMEPRRGLIIGGLAATAIVTFVIFAILAIRLASAPRQPRHADLPSPNGLEPNQLASPRPGQLGDRSSPATLPAPDGGWPEAPRSLEGMDGVPDGMLIRGSFEGEGDEDETSTGEVFISAFFIDRTETTNAQYAECVDADVCRPPTSSGP